MKIYTDLDVNYIIIGIIAFLAVPFVSIWVLNTLFGTGIDYTLETWFASLLLTSFVGGIKIKTSTKEKVVIDDEKNE